MEFINKMTSVLEPVMKDLLFFLIKCYLKSVLCDTCEIYHCEVNLCDVRCKLYQIGAEVEIVLK